MSPTRFFTAAAACVLAVVTGPAVAGATAPPRTEMRSFVCQHAFDPPARALSVQAVMRPVAQTARMQMQFDLLRQKPGHAFVVVRGRNLGTWLSPSDPTLGQNPGDVWVVNHPVVNLSAPAKYRFRVTFRWLGSGGQVLSTAVQSSPNCYQPELRPDLVVRSVVVQPISSGPSAGQATYIAAIANRGNSGAGPFGVEFTNGNGASQTAPIPSLAAHAATRQAFVGPACSAGTTLTVTVDPTHSVDEYDLANNRFTMACPTPAASSPVTSASTSAPASG